MNIPRRWTTDFHIFLNQDVLLNHWLVLVWNIFIFPYIWNNHPNWLIFFKMVQTTNQISLGGVFSCLGARSGWESWSSCSYLIPLLRILAGCPVGWPVRSGPRPSLSQLMGCSSRATKADRWGMAWRCWQWLAVAGMMFFMLLLVWGHVVPQTVCWCSMV